MGNFRVFLAAGDKWEIGDGSSWPGKSCLFFLIRRRLLKALSARYSNQAKKSGVVFAPSGARERPLEKPISEFNLVPTRPYP